MNAKKLILATAILAVSTGAVATETKRLAFSKKMGVEVTVAKDSWCQESAAVTFKASDPNFFTSQGKALKFMKALGTRVFPKECPTATNVQVTGVTADGKTIYNGTAEKQQGWVLAEAKTDPAPQSKQVEVAKAAPVLEKKTEEVAKTAPAAPEKPKAESAPQKPQQVAKKAPEAAKPKPAAAVEPAKPEPPAMFAVNGWTPTLNASEVIYTKGTRDIKMVTADGCGVYVDGINTDMMGAYSVHVSKGFTCDKGMLRGKGTVQVKRSDGRLVRNTKARYEAGYPFAESIKGNIWPQLRADNRYGRMYAYIGSDFENKAHHLYLLQKGSNGVFTPQGDTYVITENESALKQEQSLKSMVDSSYKHTKEFRGKYVSSSIHVMNRIPEVKPKPYTLYHMNIYYQDYNRKLTFDYNRARNYVFQIEQERIEKARRIAERKRQEEERRIALERREAERKAQRERWEAEQKRKQEERLAAAKKREEEQRQRQMQYEYENLLQGSEETVIGYRMGVYGLNRLTYVKLGKDAATGDKDPVVTRVKVGSVDGQTATASWPYAIQISTEKPLKEDTWYLVEGELSASFDLVDEDGLLVPQISATKVIACEKEACKDMADPLTAIRERNNQPDWVPAKASNG